MTFVLSPRGQHGLPLLTPGYLIFSNIAPDSERQRENGKNQNDPSDQSMYQLLLSSFSAEVHTAKSSHFHNKINSAPDMRNLFRTFNYLLFPPTPPSTTSITADDFSFFFTDKTKTISSQFSKNCKKSSHIFWVGSRLGVDRYVFFRADADYYRSSRPITDILNRYTCLV